KGYGVYVGAFENIMNVDLLCKKLIKDGFDEIAILVGMTDQMNKVYDFNRNFKIHKIVIGSFEKEKQALRAKARLELEGYDALIVKY
ncbi:MAG: SPOR domain-containing protein, partial [Cytophagales bacterium]